MEKREYFLGLDMGTSSVQKEKIFGESGSLRKRRPL